jgi:DNA mismatch endonuclease, patch repair protein
MEVSCANCGKVITRKPSALRERNYCSRACHYASGSPRPGRQYGTTRKCEVCRADFYAPRARPDARFCSRTCKGVASRASFACEVCGTESYGFRNRNKRWCSRACASAARKDGETLICARCGNGFYAPKGRADLAETRFCSAACHNAWQGRNKTEHVCKICGASFRWPPSRAGGGKYNITYCSLACRDADPERATMLLAMNAIQGTRRMTKPERIGYALLDSLGVQYKPQAMFDGKFCVDALLPELYAVVRFDGDYWHDRKGTSTEPRILQHVSRDRSQDAYIRACGWTVIRLWESDLKKNLRACEDKIRQHLRLPS